MSLVLAVAAGAGVYLVATEGSPGGGVRPSSVAGMVRSAAPRGRLLLEQAGLVGVAPTQFALASLAVGVLAAAPAVALFGPGLPSVTIALFATAIPSTFWRRRRQARRLAARESWPRMIEELRVLVGSAGRSIPQSLIEVGLRGPEEMRPAFEAAQREWALTTDFARTVTTLKEHLDDPTADATCETLLVAADVGGDIDSRLAALAQDRRTDLIGRREARAKQAGARLARSFVIVVPAGMAIAGLSVGDGRAAYVTPQGQGLVIAGLALVAACWMWAGRIMRLPEPERVFDR